jgi:hypothetical protein
MKGSIETREPKTEKSRELRGALPASNDQIELPQSPPIDVHPIPRRLI